MNGILILAPFALLGIVWVLLAFEEWLEKPDKQRSIEQVANHEWTPKRSHKP